MLDKGYWILVTGFFDEYLFRKSNPFTRTLLRLTVNPTLSYLDFLGHNEHNETGPMIRWTLIS